MLLILDFEIKKIPATLLNSKGLDRLYVCLFRCQKPARDLWYGSRKALNSRAFFFVPPPVNP